MPRANRHFLPGHIWHITHRCHNRAFLLQRRIDRSCWIQELGEAKRRYDLRILNYIATSNHIHILAYDPTGTCIPQAMQWVAGRTAEQYNLRRKRTGAFWSDRYHATAIDRQDYLWRCMLYINLNMVRAGAVKHPLQWFPSGYAELLSPKKRYGLLSWPDLLDLMGMEEVNDLQKTSTQQIAEALETGIGSRDTNWSESIAVGNIDFLQNIKSQLGYRIRGRRIQTTDNMMYIREPQLAGDKRYGWSVLIGDNSREWHVTADPF